VSQYLYSERPPPYPHQIRCCPIASIDHDDGVAWLKGLYATLEMIGMEEGRDYVTASLTMFCFAQHHAAERFYNALLLDLGANLSLREFL
jgi:hypothetical protein